jgi:hypothetical protein
MLRRISITSLDNYIVGDSDPVNGYLSQDPSFAGFSGHDSHTSCVSSLEQNVNALVKE